MPVLTQPHTTSQITSRNGQQIIVLDHLIFSILLATPLLKNVAIFILHICDTPICQKISLTEMDLPTLSKISNGMSVFGVQPRTQFGLSGVLYWLEKIWKAILLMPSLTTFNMLKDGWHHSASIFKHLEYSSSNSGFSAIGFRETAQHSHATIIIQPIFYDSLSPR